MDVLAIPVIIGICLALGGTIAVAIPNPDRFRNISIRRGAGYGCAASGCAFLATYLPSWYGVPIAIASYPVMGYLMMKLAEWTDERWG